MTDRQFTALLATILQAAMLPSTPSYTIAHAINDAEEIQHQVKARALATKRKAVRNATE